MPLVVLPGVGHGDTDKETIESLVLVLNRYKRELEYALANLDIINFHSTVVNEIKEDKNLWGAL